MSNEPWRRPAIIAQTQLLLDSFEYWTGKQLLGRTGTIEEQARALFLAPFVVASHGTQLEPILTYGNQRALELWEMDLDTLLATPSSRTAEPVHQAERRQMLERASRQGFIDDYSGIRISSTGLRFRIEKAIIWSLCDSRRRPLGQAVTFSQWQRL